MYTISVWTDSSSYTYFVYYSGGASYHQMQITACLKVCELTGAPALGEKAYHTA